MQGEQVKLYSNRQLRDLLIPLLIEQTLVMLVGRNVCWNFHV